MTPTEALSELQSQTPKVQIALAQIAQEVTRATKKHFHWPHDTIHAAAIVNEESGELTRAALQYQYENGPLSAMRTEAIHTGATTVRFLINLQ